MKYTILIFLCFALFLLFINNKTIEQFSNCGIPKFFRKQKNQTNNLDKLHPNQKFLFKKNNYKDIINSKDHCPIGELKQCSNHDMYNHHDKSSRLNNKKKYMHI
tara:strand:+ start:166 stop:477 length:312 start_codon:yes stop_codon:yes gene_type:complete